MFASGRSYNVIVLYIQINLNWGFPTLKETEVGSFSLRIQSMIWNFLIRTRTSQTWPVEEPKNKNKFFLPRGKLIGLIWWSFTKNWTHLFKWLIQNCLLRDYFSEGKGDFYRYFISYFHFFLYNFMNKNVQTLCQWKSRKIWILFGIKNSDE